MGVIDEVKQKTDIVEIIGQYVALTKAGRTLKGLCPFHSEKHPSFFVYPERQSWHCFGACNTGGDVFSFIMKKESMGFGDALRLLAEKVGVTISTKSELKTEGMARLHQANQAATKYFHNLLLNSPAGGKARNYLSGRGLLPKTISDFQLGLSPNSRDALKKYLIERDYTESELVRVGLIIESETGKTHDRFRNKLMFPIHDIRGRIVGFGARALDDSLPKYLNSPQTPTFDKSSNLYAINLAKTAIKQQELAVIVEGYMDVITAHQNGFNNVVASMGTSVTERQVGILKKLTPNIALALDADAAGEEAMLRGISYENIFNTEVKVIILPEGKDPDDVIKEDTKTWHKLLNEALPVTDYTFNVVTAKLDLATARGKSIAADKLLSIIADIKNDTRRDHYMRKLAELIGASYNNIEAALSRIKPDRRATEPRPKVVASATQPLLSSPVEEYCLALLLQHPELKGNDKGLTPEYFENSQNREIFIGWQRTGDLSTLKTELDQAIQEHLDALAARSLPSTRTEERYADCVLRLREKYIRSLESKRAAVLASEAKEGGTAAELDKLKEQGVEPSVQLGEIFTQKIRRANIKGGGSETGKQR